MSNLYIKIKDREYRERETVALSIVTSKMLNNFDKSVIFNIIEDIFADHCSQSLHYFSSSFCVPFAVAESRAGVILLFYDKKGTCTAIVSITIDTT